MFQETDKKFRKTTETDCPNRKLIDPLDVDIIVRSVIGERDWQSKLAILTNKWKEECYSKGVSLASVEVATDILKDIEFNGKGVKHCCRHCGVNPENERQTRFCLCPCGYCALKVKDVNEYFCAVKDDLISKELIERLKQYIAVFENVPEEKKDWSPDSDKQILDLINPSLFCYVKGVSTLKSKQRNKTITCDTSFLPSELLLTENGKIEFKSYINNVDERKHKGFYEIISKILSKFVPLFSEFTDFEPGSVQVVVKAFNIIVKPGSYFVGETWHKEGLPQENIKAIGMFCYHSENVNNSFLELRRSIDPSDIQKENETAQGVFENCGLHNGDLLFDHLGSVQMKEGRCVAFGNKEAQHRFKYFFPIDPFIPAIHKILVFFLVDPEKSIISTEFVEPQQLGILFSKYFILIKLFPTEVYFNIIEFLPHFSLGQAKSFREKLLNARKRYNNYINQEEFEKEFRM
ncbi:hypothetical protein ABK040_015176 [Willaertia magna]